MSNKKFIPVERLNGVVMTERMQNAFPEEELKNFAHTIISITKTSPKQEWPVGCTFLAFVANGPKGLYVINCETNKKDILTFDGYTHPSKMGDLVEYKGRRLKKMDTINGIPRYAILQDNRSMKNTKKSFQIALLSSENYL